jgi:hypothetical protein
MVVQELMVVATMEEEEDLLLEQDLSEATVLIVLVGLPLPEEGMAVMEEMDQAEMDQLGLLLEEEEEVPIEVLS